MGLRADATVGLRAMELCANGAAGLWRWSLMGLRADWAAGLGVMGLRAVGAAGLRTMGLHVPGAPGL